MIRTRTTNRAWRDIEIDDDGEVVHDVGAVRCPRCQHPLDLGGLDDIDVHRCGFCLKRTRFLWSDRRGLPVPDARGPNADWGDEDEGWWDDFESDEEEYGDEEGCGCGCLDPVFGGPVEPVCERGRWMCPVCGAADVGEA